MEYMIKLSSIFTRLQDILVLYVLIDEHVWTRCLQ